MQDSDGWATDSEMMRRRGRRCSKALYPKAGHFWVSLGHEEWSGPAECRIPRSVLEGSKKGVDGGASSDCIDTVPKHVTLLIVWYTDPPPSTAIFSSFLSFLCYWVRLPVKSFWEPCLSELQRPGMPANRITTEHPQWIPWNHSSCCWPGHPRPCQLSMGIESGRCSLRFRGPSLIHDSTPLRKSSVSLQFLATKPNSND